MSQLLIRSGARAGTSVAVAETAELVLGRGRDADIQLDDPRVSRRHAVLRRMGDRTTIEDLGSQNGTFVDGRRIEGSAVLAGGEAILVGDTRLTYGVRVSGPPSTLATSVRLPGTATIERAVLRASVVRANRVAAAAATVVGVVAVVVALVVLTGGDAGRADLIEALRPSVVQILADRDAGTASGTGWVLDDSEGLIVTNHHVVDGSVALTISGEGHASRPAEIVATAPCEDLALLRVADVTDLRAVELGSQADLKQGEDVITLGYPGTAGPGTDLVATDGIVSVVRTSWTTSVAADVPRYPNLILTDAAINPGNSGGPLMSLDRRLVGVNSAGITDIAGRAIQSQGYAIGVDRVREIVPTLRSGRSLGWTGMSLDPPTDDRLFALGLSTSFGPGLVVERVSPGSPAESAGLGRSPFLIIAIDDQPMDGYLYTYCDAVGSRGSGETARFRIIEAGAMEPRTVTVEFR